MSGMALPAAGACAAPASFCAGGMTRGMPVPVAGMEARSPAPRMPSIILLMSGMTADPPWPEEKDCHSSRLMPPL